MTVREFNRKTVVDVLRRAGFPDLADKAQMELPDPVDVETVSRFAAPYGVTRDELIQRMGGSP